MENIKEYISKNEQRFLSELMEWLRIPSVSADSKYKDDVARAAKFIAEKFTIAVLIKLKFALQKGIPLYMAKKLSIPN